MATPVPAISRKILPPHWVLVCLALEGALHRWAPVTQWLVGPARLVGAAVFALGLVPLLWAFLLFRRAKTGIVPFSDSTTLVAQGPYRFTRNPMYLGMATVLLGVALGLGSVTPLVAPVLFVTLITNLFIRPEEAHLEAAFGAPYLAFKGRIRRWL